MKIIIKKSFQDDLSWFNWDIFSKISSIIDIIENNELRNIYKFLDLKKISWYKSYYRIRVWNYRVWLKIENNILFFVRIKLRKDIYKIFP